MHYPDLSWNVIVSPPFKYLEGIYVHFRHLCSECKRHKITCAYMLTSATFISLQFMSVAVKSPRTSHLITIFFIYFCRVIPFYATPWVSVHSTGAAHASSMYLETTMLVCWFVSRSTTLIKPKYFSVGVVFFLVFMV